MVGITGLLDRKRNFGSLHSSPFPLVIELWKRIAVN